MSKISDDNLFDLPLERPDAMVELPIGVVMPGKVVAEELEIIEEAYRLQGHAVCHMIMFDDVAEDDETELFSNAAQWGGALGFPPSRPPTTSEAKEWLIYWQAALDVIIWYTIEEFRAKQAAMPKPGPMGKPAAPVRSSVEPGTRQGPKA